MNRGSWVVGRGWRMLAVAAACAVLGGATHDPRPTTRHDVHVTLTRMAVDSITIVTRVRCFKDDLQLGLARFYKLQKLELVAGRLADSLFEGYLAERMWVVADSARVRGTVQGSGVEVDDQGQPMMWFVVEYPAPRRMRSVGVRNDLLFEMFPSQQNIVNVLSVKDDKRYSFYFVPGSEKLQSITLP